MNRSTTTDKVVGIIFALLGGCSLAGQALAGAMGQMAASSGQHVAVSSGPAMIISILSGIVMIAVGIGVFMAARWAFLVGSIVCGLTIIYSGYALASGQMADTMAKAQAAQPAAAQTGQMTQTIGMATAILTMVITLGFGAYFVWRLTSK